MCVCSCVFVCSAEKDNRSDDEETEAGGEDGSMLSAEREAGKVIAANKNPSTLVRELAMDYICRQEGAGSNYYEEEQERKNSLLCMWAASAAATAPAADDEPGEWRCHVL